MLMNRVASSSAVRDATPEKRKRPSFETARCAGLLRMRAEYFEAISRGNRR
jgi:hypothetical protein